jgi:ActR/RegA family two-component response regulator
VTLSNAKESEAGLLLSGVKPIPREDMRAMKTIAVKQDESVAILVIGADLSACRVYRRALLMKGYTAAVALDREEMLLLAERIKPKVILVDLDMPALGEFNTIESIRKVAPDAVPIVITANEMVDFALEDIDNGRLQCLCKPVDEQMLLKAVRQALARETNTEESSPPCLIGARWSGNGHAILEVLERASRDNQFICKLTNEGSKALEEYRLTWEEKAALISGDVRWIEMHVGPLSDRQKTWLNCRLQQERW